MQRKCEKNLDFSTNISLYLKNDTRYDFGNYGMRIGNRSQSRTILCNCYILIIFIIMG